jgi:hypothetical protein
LVESVQKNKGQGKLSLTPNLLLNLVSYPVEAQCTIVSCFLKSRPLCDQTGVPVPSWPDFTDNFIELLLFIEQTYQQIKAI